MKIEGNVTSRTRFIHHNTTALCCTIRKDSNRVKLTISTRWRPSLIVEHKCLRSRIDLQENIAHVHLGLNSSCWWPSHSDLVMKSCWSYLLMIVRPWLSSQFIFMHHWFLVPVYRLHAIRPGSVTSFHIILPNLESSETRMRSSGRNESRRNRRDIFMRSV